MDANTLMLSLSDKLPKGPEMMTVKQRLERLSPEEQADAAGRIALVQFKSPILGFVLSFFFGGLGVDRFYIGDIGLGILKLCLNLIFIGLIWDVIDWFIIMKRIKKDNYQKLMMIL